MGAVPFSDTDNIGISLVSIVNIYNTPTLFFKKERILKGT